MRSYQWEAWYYYQVAPPTVRTSDWPEVTQLWMFILKGALSLMEMWNISYIFPNCLIICHNFYSKGWRKRCGLGSQAASLGHKVQIIFRSTIVFWFVFFKRKCVCVAVRNVGEPGRRFENPKPFGHEPAEGTPKSLVFSREGVRIKP